MQHFRLQCHTNIYLQARSFSRGIFYPKLGTALELMKKQECHLKKLTFIL
jgi:hypothetical protein